MASAPLDKLLNKVITNLIPESSDKMEAVKRFVAQVQLGGGDNR